MLDGFQSNEPFPKRFKRLAPAFPGQDRSHDQEKIQKLEEQISIQNSQINHLVAVNLSWQQMCLTLQRANAELSNEMSGLQSIVTELVAANAELIEMNHQLLNNSPILNTSPIFIPQFSAQQSNSAPNGDIAVNSEAHPEEESFTTMRIDHSNRA